MGLSLMITLSPSLDSLTPGKEEPLDLLGLGAQS
jgi:hypothetical protein